MARQTRPPFIPREVWDRAHKGGERLPSITWYAGRIEEEEPLDDLSGLPPVDHDALRQLAKAHHISLWSMVKGKT